MDNLMSVPSTEIAGLVKTMITKGHQVSNMVGDQIKAQVKKIMRDYYEGIDADFDMQEEARLSGYDTFDEFIEDSDDFMTLTMEVVAGFEEGFNKAWFHYLE